MRNDLIYQQFADNSPSTVIGFTSGGTATLYPISGFSGGGGSGTITGATNGLSVSGANIKLGGILTGATDITFTGFSSSLVVENTDAKQRLTVDSDYILLESGDYLSFSGNAAQLQIDSNNILAYSQDDTGDSVQIDIVALPNSFKIHDNRATATGIEYDANYSAAYTPRSLVDKGYVTGITSSLSSVPSGAFTNYTSSSLTLNPTQEINNNYRWAIPASNPTLTWDFTGVPDGASGILEIIHDNSATSRYIALPTGSTMNYDDIIEATAIGASAKNITNTANNGSGNIRVTCSGHSFTTGDRVLITGVLGTIEANGRWTVTVIDANTFDIGGYVNAYTSSGTATLLNKYLAIEQSALALTTVSFYNRNGIMRLNLRRGYFDV